jgi:hypothetical protein
VKVVEDTPRLSLRLISELDAWEEIVVAGEVTLTIAHAGTTITTTVTLDFDWSPFGRRAWLSCPTCGSRRRDLFLDAGELKCRSCARLLYYAQRLPASSWRDVALPVLRAARNHDQLREPAEAG